jgi:hypothetical protein
MEAKTSVTYNGMTAEITAAINVIVGVDVSVKITKDGELVENAKFLEYGEWNKKEAKKRTGVEMFGRIGRVELTAGSYNVIAPAVIKAKNEVLGMLEAAIPGIAELSVAYDLYETEARELKEKEEKAHEHDFYIPPSREMFYKAEKDCAEIVKRHPIAAAYHDWAKKDPASRYGHACLNAARALLTGKTLADATAIANDYDHWD